MLFFIETELSIFVCLRFLIVDLFCSTFNELNKNEINLEKRFKTGIGRDEINLKSMRNILKGIE